MAYRIMELTLISANDLKAVNLFTPMRVYAIISISSDGPRSRRRITADHVGGRNPNWNATLQFTFPSGDISNLFLRILLRAKRILGDRDVGFVQIPIRDIVTGAGDKGFLSYQVRRPISGKPKGVLNLSYKITNPNTPPSQALENHENLSQAPITVRPPVPYYHAQPPYGYGAPGIQPSMPPACGYTPVGYGYPPVGHGYPPVGYGYPPAGYGYGAPALPLAPMNFSKGISSMGFAAGILGGAVGGLLIGDAISGTGAYGDGFDGGSAFF